MSTDLVLTQISHGVAVVTFNRPDHRNAWSDPMAREYVAALHALEADDTAKVIVVTGAGGDFSVGGGMDDLQGFAESGTLSIEETPRPDHLVTTTIAKPVIAAIDGACAGIGLVQALMCDIRFASPRSRFSTAFARRGLAAEQGSSWVLPRLVGTANALDLLLSARKLGAEEALRLGLVNRVADPVLDAAVEYARDLAAACSPASMATIKAQVWSDLERDFLPSVRRADQLAERHVGGVDFGEGVASFVERRPAVFSGLSMGRVQDIDA
jgi:enoyl-CoA hydratase/carnithine racemase